MCSAYYSVEERDEEVPFRCLFHVHTRRSFDSIVPVRKVVNRARELGVDVLIVTDHDTIQGSLEAGATAQGRPMVVTAAEYQSEKGDIIGMFLREEIRSRRAQEVVRQVHAQGGLVVLPHPYKGHMLDDELLTGVDLIESFNGRCSGADNAKAEELARQWNLPAFGGADAHCLAELGAVVNEFMSEPPRTEVQLKRQLLHAPRRIITQPSSPLCRPYSQMIKAIKTGDPKLFLYQIKRLALVLRKTHSQSTHT